MTDFTSFFFGKNQLITLILREYLSDRLLQQQIVELHPSDRVTIGRSVNARYKIGGGYPIEIRNNISRIQATVVCEEDRIFVQDGNGKPSKHGIFVGFNPYARALLTEKNPVIVFMCGDAKAILSYPKGREVLDGLPTGVNKDRIDLVEQIGLLQEAIDEFSEDLKLHRAFVGENFSRVAQRESQQEVKISELIERLDHQQAVDSNQTKTLEEIRAAERCLRRLLFSLFLVLALIGGYQFSKDLKINTLDFPLPKAVIATILESTGFWEFTIGGVGIWLFRKSKQNKLGVGNRVE